MTTDKITLRCSSKGVPVDVDVSTVVKAIEWSAGQDWRTGVVPSHSTEIDGYTVTGENMHNKFVILPDGTHYYTGENITLGFSGEGEKFGLRSRSQLVQTIQEN